MRVRHQAVLGLIGLLGFLVLWPVWASSAQASAPPQGKPALYEFGAGYCYSCKEMAKVMAELQPAYSKQVELRMVYADKEKDLFQQYKIMLIPTQVFLDASGQEVDRHIGALSKDEVIKKLKQLKFIR
jgi:thiol-disulfide isomerase/thioredoxin